MNDDRERDESGQFESEYTDQEIIQAVRLSEPAGTQEVADELGIARQSVDYRLRKLLDQGRVKKKKIGNSLAWSVSEEYENH